MHDKAFLNNLLFFLQESTPFYLSVAKLTNQNDAAIKLYEKISRNVLAIVCRLITNKESEVSVVRDFWISAD